MKKIISTLTAAFSIAAALLPFGTQAESPELTNLMKTMPRDSSIYIVMNIAELSDLVPIWDRDENGIRRMKPEFKSELDIKSEFDSVFEEFLFEKIETNKVSWAVIGLSNPKLMDTDPVSAGVNVRFSGDFTYDEIKSVAEAEHFDLPPAGDIFQPEEEMHMTLFSDHYAGISTNPSHLALNHDEELSKSSVHLEQLLPIAPSFSAIIPMDLILSELQPGAYPPNLQEVDVFSITLNKVDDGYSLDALVEYQNPESLETGYGMVNGYRQMAPMFLQQAKQQMEMVSDQTDPHLIKQKKMLMEVEKTINGATVSKVGKNLVVRLPVNSDLFAEAFQTTMVSGFLNARKTSRLNACQENQAKLDGAVQQYILEENKPNLAACTELHTTDVSDPKLQGVIFGNTGYIRKVVICPSGGTYSILKTDGPNGEAARCSLPEHPFPGGNW